MISSHLIKRLIKKAGNQYQLSKITGISESKLNNIKRGRQYFTADDLGMMVNLGILEKEDALKCNFHDGLKDKNLYCRVASILISLPAMQAVGQFLSETASYCILCKIRLTPRY